MFIKRGARSLHRDNRSARAAEKKKRLKNYFEENLKMGYSFARKLDSRVKIKGYLYKFSGKSRLQPSTFLTLLPYPLPLAPCAQSHPLFWRRVDPHKKVF